MKRSSHTKEQMAFTLQQAELATSVTEVFPKVRAGRHIFHLWTTSLLHVP